VPALVEREHAELASEGPETGEPVEIGVGAETVQQDEGRRAGAGAGAGRAVLMASGAGRAVLMASGAGRAVLMASGAGRAERMASGAGRARNLADERGAPPRELDAPARGERWSRRGQAPTSTMSTLRFPLGASYSTVSPA
jgi:hypothetical protein